MNLSTALTYPPNKSVAYCIGYFASAIGMGRVHKRFESIFIHILCPLSFTRFISTQVGIWKSTSRKWLDNDAGSSSLPYLMRTESYLGRPDNYQLLTACIVSPDVFCVLSHWYGILYTGIVFLLE